MKRLLFLGGAKSQCYAISKAKEMGYHTILCDYLADNPGRLVADEWYPVSTTDSDSVLKVAIKTKIDGVLTYGSDVAAPAVAYVAEELGLPGGPYESVYTLTHKDRFRKFLSDNGFNTPWSIAFSENERKDAVDFIKNKNVPLVVKPVDSQGAKGISKIVDSCQADAAVEYAFSKSICKRIIVEEYIERSGMQVGGDVFAIEGKIVFAPFSNTYFSNEPGLEFIPLAEFWPPVSSPDLLNRMQTELQRAISLLGLGTQSLNFEAIEDKSGNIYIIEIGPRNGGSLVPIVMEKMTGFDETKAIIQAAAGDTICDTDSHDINGFWASRGIGIGKTCVLDHLVIDKSFSDNHLCAIEQYVENGKTAPAMKALNDSIAFCIAHFDTREEMMDFIEHPTKYIQLCFQDKY